MQAQRKYKLSHGNFCVSAINVPSIPNSVNFVKNDPRVCLNRKKLKKIETTWIRVRPQLHLHF